MSGTRPNTRSAIDGSTPSGDAGDARAALSADRTVVLSAGVSSHDTCEAVMQLLAQVRELLPALTRRTEAPSQPSLRRCSWRSVSSQ